MQRGVVVAICWSLCFGTLPATVINPEIYQQMNISNPNVTTLSQKAFDEFPVYHNSRLKNPVMISHLDNTGSIWFCVRNVKSSEPTTVMCIPCSRAKAKKYCKLFTDMEWKEGTEFVCSSDPESIPSARPVKLLVAYLEYVATDEISRMDETTYCITTIDKG